MSAVPFDVRVLEPGGDGGVRLLGGRCARCHTLHFPPPARECPRCGGSPVAAEPLPAAGVVHSATTLPFPLPGTAVSATVALVEMAADLLVQGVATEPVAIGAEVRVVARRLPGDPELLAYGFAPVAHA